MSNSKQQVHNSGVRAEVIRYCQLGLQPIPVPVSAKRPAINRWPQLHVAAEDVREYFQDVNQNVGIVLGDIADLDCDSTEAVSVARFIAPTTTWTYGRASKPDSHYIYSVEEGIVSEQYKDPSDHTMIVELRCLKKDKTKGLHTILPPSVHPSGEHVVWSRGSDASKEPTRANASNLQSAVRLIAGIALLAKHFPKAGEGRHKFMLALAGTLARAGVEQEDARTICVVLYRSVPNHDSDALERVAAEVADTYRNCKDNQHYTGYKTLTSLLDQRILRKALKWLNADAPEVQKEPPTETSPRSSIQLDNRDLREKSHAVLDVLYASNNPPVIFRRGSSSVRVIVSGSSPHIVKISEHQMISRMTDAASFVKGAKKVDPPSNVAADVLLRLPMDERFPELRGVSASPIFRSDGTVFATPGYDPATKLIYVPPAGFSMPPLPDHPTQEQVQVALDLLKDVLQDFPFSSDADRANAIGLMLISVLRSALQGNNPFFLVTATKERTGKGLLVDVVAVLATGRSSQIRPYPKDNSEFKPEITTVLQDSPNLVVFDNVPKGRVLDSDDLCALATAKEWVARCYHTNDQQHVLPVTGTWIFTGNNLQVGGEIPARCIRIALDAKRADPQLRTGWKHNPLLDYVKANRGNLVWAVLVLARAWFVAGKPSPTKVTPLGNFEEMTLMIGGILEYAGMPDFRENEKVVRDMDSDNTQIEAFLYALFDAFDRKPFVALDVDEKIKLEGNTDLARAVPDSLKEGIERSGTFTRKLGRLLTSRIGTRYGTENIYVESSPSGNATKYRINFGDGSSRSLPPPKPFAARKKANEHGEVTPTSECVVDGGISGQALFHSGEEVQSDSSAPYDHNDSGDESGEDYFARLAMEAGLEMGADRLVH